MSKNHKFKKNNNKGKRIVEELRKEITIPSNISSIYIILLFAIFVFSLYIRIIMPWNSVFIGNYVAFANDDAVYHMRLVENTLANFPHQITYDPFTFYPFGSKIHWGPLFTQMIAGLILIVSFGNPTQQIINTVGAIFPSILGALVVFPVYYIGKHLVNRNAGLLSALLITILPGQFFQRSTLGFTDNHVAEVLFITASILFYMLALKFGKEVNSNTLELRKFKKPLIFSVLAGIMFASYQLSWTGATLFALIVFIFIVVQSLIEILKGKSTNYILIASVPMFLIDLIAVLPYVDWGSGFSFMFYSIFHIVVPIIGIALAYIFYMVSIITINNKKPFYNIVYLSMFSLVGFIILTIMLPSLLSSVINAPSAVFDSGRIGGVRTIGEASSIFDRPGMLGNSFPVLGVFRSDDIIAMFIMLALAFISYKAIRYQNSIDMLFLIWNIIMFLAIRGQNRWAYYFAVNVSLMVGYVGIPLVESILKSCSWNWVNNIISYKRNYFNARLSLVASFAIIIMFIYPSMIITVIGSHPQAKLGGGEPSGGGLLEWYEALTWMRNNTPDTGIDYYGTYNKPKIPYASLDDMVNTTYNYPKTAYGVMSWWDYGHAITYIAHRIPNANPFQSGIGGTSRHDAGASAFLTAKSESEANKLLDNLGINGRPGTRYIITNGYMAYQLMDVYGIWNDDGSYMTMLQTSQGNKIIPSERYYQNMVSKLHIFDGNNLGTYRLVHESSRNPNTLGGYQEQNIKNICNSLYNCNIPIEYSGVVKIFEHVKGAKILIRVPINTQMSLTNVIKTNIGRTIPYSAPLVINNNEYVFTVPYSTGKPIINETQFDTTVVGSYILNIGNQSAKIDVTEQQILSGTTLELVLKP